MLRKTLSSALALALIACLPVVAQLIEDDETELLPLFSLEEILDHYYSAIGGEEAWQALRSIKASGTMTMGPGMDAPFTIYQQLPDKQRLEFSFQQMTAIQAVDGDQAWQVNPLLGKTAPEAMPPEQVAAVKELIDIEGPLVSPASKGHTLVLVGPGKAQGVDAYVIQATLASGKLETFYLDAETFLPFLMESSSMIQGVRVDFETTFSEYEPVDDLMIARKIENHPKGQPGGQVVTVTEVEIDPDLSGVQFALPTTGQ
jgi:hypothetical protein